MTRDRIVSMAKHAYSQGHPKELPEVQFLMSTHDLARFADLVLEEAAKHFEAFARQLEMRGEHPINAPAIIGSIRALKSEAK